MRPLLLTIALACTVLPLMTTAKDIIDPIQAMQEASLTRQSQTISGVLSVYWQEQEIKLALNTDAASQQQLFRNTPKPKLIDHTRSDMKFVDLHWHGDKAQLQQALNQAFGKHLPASFWQNRYGIVNLPARVNIQNFQLTDANCDQYAFSAELLSVQSEPRSTVAPIYADSCASGIALPRYRVSAPDGYANLRQAPNTKAAITQRLPKQTTVLELKQNGAWKLVQVLEQTGNPVTGFVHQSQVSLMEDEQ